jgi:hypothetical protein
MTMRIERTPAAATAATTRPNEHTSDQDGGGGNFPWGLVGIMAMPAAFGVAMKVVGHTPDHNINDRVRWLGDLRRVQGELDTVTAGTDVSSIATKLDALASRTTSPSSLQVSFRVAGSGIRHAGESLERSAQLLRSGDIAGARQHTNWPMSFMHTGVNAAVVDRYLVDSEERINHTATFQGTGPEEVRAAGAGLFSRIRSGHVTTGDSLWMAGGLIAAFVGGTLVYGALRDN